MPKQFNPYSDDLPDRDPDPPARPWPAPVCDRGDADALVLDPDAPAPLGDWPAGLERPSRATPRWCVCGAPDYEHPARGCAGFRYDVLSPLNTF